MWNNIFLSVVIVVAMMVSQALAEPDDPVHFNDANLKAAVEAALGVTDPNEADMLNLTGLEVWDQGITSLTGIEYANNLDVLMLPENQISDLTSLSGLTSLIHLDLGANQISDLSALSGLTNLQMLVLPVNDINDVTPTPVPEAIAVNESASG